MAKQQITTGYSANRLPYVKIGEGEKNLVVFEGLNFTHKPPSGMSLRMGTQMFRGLPADYTIYIVGRKPDLPTGYTMSNMANDYAEMINQHIGIPVFVAGLSTGGPPAMCLAVEQPDLVRKLVLVSTGYRLSDHGKQAQRKMLEAARSGSKRKTAAATAGLLASGVAGQLLKGLFWLMGPLMYESGNSLSDGIAELEAEDAFDFKNRLCDIKVPTLVIGGEDDLLYPLRETAGNIPECTLILYPNAGHTASMKKEFKKDLVDFLG